MKKITVESKMRITFELFNDKQIEEVKKFAEKNNLTLFSAIARLYGIDTAEFMMYRGNDISNPCRMSIGEEVGQDKVESVPLSHDTLVALCQTISDLQAENESLKDKLSRVLLSVDTVKEMNTMVTIDEHKKQAVKDFAEELKMRFDRKYKDRGATDARVLMAQSNFLTCIDELLNEWVEK